MTIHHHPSEATLLDYAAGSLGEGMSLLMAVHIALCPICQGEIAAAEAVGGGMLDELPPETLAEGAHGRILSRLDEAPPTPAKPPASRVDDPLLPGPLAAHFGKKLADLPWRMLMPGLRQVDLHPGRRRGANLRLLRLGPGRALPRHSHSGTELTLVLQGAFRDEIGRFARGDLAEVDGEVVHQPRVDGSEDCICLIATDAPLRFPGFIARIAQRFTGI